MTEFLQLSFDGLTTGTIYALVAVGLTLGIGVARFFNFAQGQFVILAGFVGLTLAEHGVPFFLSLPITLVVVAIVGVVLRNVVVRFARNDSLVVFLGTLGFGIIIEYATVLIWGADQAVIKTPFPGSVTLGGVVIQDNDLMLIAISAPVIIVLYILLARTDTGLRLRSCAENVEVSSLLGIDVPRTMMISIALGSGLAALAGILLGTLFQFNAFGGTTLLVVGIAVALAGGLGSVTGAVVCGVLLGLAETYLTSYGLHLGFYTFGSQWQQGYTFVLMIAILAWRPRGLFRGTGES